MVGSLLEKGEVEEKVKYPTTVREAVKLAKKHPKVMNEVLGEDLAKRYIEHIISDQEVLCPITHSDTRGKSQCTIVKSTSREVIQHTYHPQMQISLFN